jgi:hypothetical protein
MSLLSTQGQIIAEVLVNNDIFLTYFVSSVLAIVEAMWGPQ